MYLVEINTRGLAVSSAGHTKSVIPVAHVVPIQLAHPAVGGQEHLPSWACGNSSWGEGLKVSNWAPSGLGVSLSFASRAYDLAWKGDLDGMLCFFQVPGL